MFLLTLALPTYCFSGVGTSGINDSIPYLITNVYISLSNGPIIVGNTSCFLSKCSTFSMAFSFLCPNGTYHLLGGPRRISLFLRSCPALLSNAYRPRQLVSVIYSFALRKSDKSMMLAFPAICPMAEAKSPPAKFRTVMPAGTCCCHDSATSGAYPYRGSLSLTFCNASSRTSFGNALLVTAKEVPLPGSLFPQPIIGRANNKLYVKGLEKADFTLFPTSCRICSKLLITYTRSSDLYKDCYTRHW